MTVVGWVSKIWFERKVVFLYESLAAFDIPIELLSALLKRILHKIQLISKQTHDSWKIKEEMIANNQVTFLVRFARLWLRAKQGCLWHERISL